MFKHCPGIKRLIAPKIIIRNCPFCGEEVEFFEYEAQQKCPRCGETVYREPSEVCITWCSYADKCIDELERKGLIDKRRLEELKKLVKKGGDKK